MDTTAAAPVLGLAVALVVAAARAIPSLPLAGREKAAAHALAALLSLGAGVASAYLAGPESLKAYDGSVATKALIDAGLTYLTAVAAGRAGGAAKRARKRKVAPPA